jgi:hypothetical protein
MNCWNVTLFALVATSCAGNLAQAQTYDHERRAACRPEVRQTIEQYAEHVTGPGAFVTEDGEARKFTMPPTPRGRATPRGRRRHTCAVFGGRADRCGHMLQSEYLANLDIAFLVNDHIAENMTWPSNVSVMRIGSRHMQGNQQWGELTFLPYLSNKGIAGNVFKPLLPENVFYMKRRFLSAKEPIGLMNATKFDTAISSGTFAIFMLLNHCEDIALCGFSDENDLLTEGKEGLLPPCRRTERLHWQHNWMEDIILRRIIMNCFEHVRLESR